MYLRESIMNNSVFSNSEECAHKHTNAVGPTMTVIKQPETLRYRGRS